MSNFEPFTPELNSPAAGLPRRVYVFARTEALEGLDSLAETLTLVEIDPEHPLPSELVAKARIAVIEVDPADTLSLRRLDAVRAARPDLSIIAGLPQVDLAITRLMLRKGVGDVVAMPFTVDDIMTAVLEVERQAMTPEQDGSDVELAPVVAVQKVVGGVGATTVATHLADAMARTIDPHARGIVIDLDLQSGDAASYLDRRSGKSLLDLVDAGSRLDEELLRSVAMNGGDAFDVVPAPSDIIPIEDLELAALRAVIDLAREKYEIVVLDMPASLTNWAMSVLLSADQVLLVADRSIRSLRQAKRKLNLLQSFDFAPAQIVLALNQIESGLFKKVDIKAIEGALGHPVVGLLQSETQVIEQAQAQGLLAKDIQRRSRFGSGIDALAAHLLASASGG